MKKTALLFSLLLITSLAISQNIAFESSDVLFDHPRPNDSGVNYPFIPLDYNSDGETDFIGGTFNDQLVYKGTGNTTYEQIDIYQGLEEVPLKVMDFDQDGDDDVLMESYINIYVENDSFFFLTPGISFQEKIIEAADFNNDGFNDLLTHKEITFENDELYIHYNQGNDEFTKELIYDQFDYGDVEIGDIDNDGDIDIAVILTFESVPIVILENTNATFEARDIPHNFDVGRATIQLHDLDFDGDLDMIAEGGSGVVVMENVDNFTTDNTTKTISLNSIIYFDMVDLNNNGHLDIVSISRSNQDMSLSVMQGKGNFEYYAAESIELFASSSFFGYPNFNYVVNNMTFADIDKDGLMDIIFTDGFSDPNQIRWLKNITVISSTKNIDAVTTSIYPNPTNQYLEIEANQSLDNIQVQITNSAGKTCFTTQLDGNRIDIEHLPPGIYIIQSTELNLVERFMKI